MRQIQRIIAESVLATLRANGLAIVPAGYASGTAIIDPQIFAKDIGANAVMAMQADEPIELGWSPAQQVRQ